MPRSAHRLRLIKKYPSLIHGDPYFQTSGNVHLGRRVLLIHPNKISGLNLTRCRKGDVKGTVIGFLSETDLDKSGNAAFISTKTSKYSTKGEPAKLFHIALDEEDMDNDAIVFDLEEWELHEYCEWIAVDVEEKVQQKQDSSWKIGAQSMCTKKCTKTSTEFERLNNLALEAAASVRNAPEKNQATERNNDTRNTSLEDGAAAGCPKCQKELDTGKKARGAHVSHCPRWGMWKKSHLSSNDNTTSAKVRRDTAADRGQPTIIGSSNGGNIDKCGKSKENTTTQSSKKTTTSSSNDDGRSISSTKSKSHKLSQIREKIIDPSIGDNRDNERSQNHNVLTTDANYSFNNILKSSLASYASKTQTKNTNNPPPPQPPPFLSHEENCTLRTALAFVMARARNRREDNDKAAELVEGLVRSNGITGSTKANRSATQHYSPLMGGLLALPPRHIRDGFSTSRLNLKASRARMALDKELKHVREVMNLAVSTLLPLYKNSSSQSMPGGQKQCAVYDYVSAAMQPIPDSSNFESLDGLCRHIIGRLSSIVNDEVLRRQLATETLSTEDERSAFSTTANDSAPKDEHSNFDIVGDELAQLQVDFIIDSFFNVSNPAQQIHQILASCHVLHRLLLLDENRTTIGSDCVAMACTLLTELYRDNCFGSRRESNSDQLNQYENSRQVKEQSGKGKVVSSRWGYFPSDYNSIREERRNQVVTAISQYHNPNSSLIGKKRSSMNQNQGCDHGYESIQLPRLGDVLAVNLLRLLEGAAAIRLHFHERYAGHYNGFMTSKAAMTAAAAEILHEIRSKTDYDLLMPIHVNGAALIYYSQALNRKERRVGKVEHLLPGAKMMLRMHLFELIQKLNMYEH